MERGWTAIMPIMSKSNRRARGPEESGEARRAWEGYEDLSPEAGFDRAPLGPWPVVWALAWMSFAAALVLCGYLACSAYYMFRFYPNTYINDVAVGNMTTLEAMDAVSGSVSKDVELVFRSGTAVIPVDELGASVACDPSVAFLASRQTGFPWVRHDYVTEVSVSYDRPVLLAAVNAALASVPDAAAASKPGVGFDGDGHMAYHDGTAAYERDDDAARDLAAAAVEAGSWSVDLRSADCYDSPYASVPDRDLENLAVQWNARVDAGLYFECGGSTHGFEAAVLAEHASRSGSTVNIDGQWLRETVAGWLGDAASRDSAGLSVRGAAVSEGAAAAMAEARLLHAADTAVAAFRDGASGVALDTSGLREWLSGGFVLVLDRDAGWATLYKDGAVAASCGASFPRDYLVADVLAVSPAGDRIALSDGSDVGGPGCRIELADTQSMLDALGGAELKCAVMVAQGGAPVESHSLPAGPDSYNVDFGGIPASS